MQQISAKNLAPMADFEREDDKPFVLNQTDDPIVLDPVSPQSGKI